jgi:hypothetical protein
VRALCGVIIDCVRRTVEHHIRRFANGGTLLLPLRAAVFTARLHSE